MRKSVRTAVTTGIAAAAMAAGLGTGFASAAPTLTSDLPTSGPVIIEGPGGLHYEMPLKPDLLKTYKFKPGAAKVAYNSPLLENKVGDIKDAVGVVSLTRVKSSNLSDAQRDSESAGMLKSISEEISKQTGAHRGDPLADAAFASRSLVNIQGDLIGFVRANHGPGPINNVAYTPMELRNTVTPWVKNLPEAKGKQAHAKIERIYLAVVDNGNGVDSVKQAKVNYDRGSNEAGRQLAKVIADATGGGYTRPQGKKPVVVSPVTHDKKGQEWVGDAVYVDSDILVPFTGK